MTTEIKRDPSPTQPGLHPETPTPTNKDQPPRTRGDVLRELGRPNAYYRLFGKALGSCNAGVFVSQLLFWSDRGASAEGWIYKTLAEWYDETALTRREIDTIRRHLRTAGVLHERHDRLHHRMYYRLDHDALDRVCDEYQRMHPSAVPEAPNRLSGKAENATREATKPPPVQVTKNTSKTTTKNKEEPAAQASAEVASPPSPAEAPILVFPCKGTGKPTWSLLPSYVEFLADAYPAVDVKQQCFAAHRWIDAKPHRKKTAGGMKHFLTSWLNREQNKGGGSSSHGMTARQADQKRRGDLIDNVILGGGGRIIQPRILSSRPLSERLSGTALEQEAAELGGWKPVVAREAELIDAP